MVHLPSQAVLGFDVDELLDELTPVRRRVPIERVLPIPTTDAEDEALTNVWWQNGPRVERSAAKLLSRKDAEELNVGFRVCAYTLLGTVFGAGGWLAFAVTTDRWALLPALAVLMVFSIAGASLGLRPSRPRRHLVVVAFAIVGLLIGLALPTVLQA